MKIVTKGYYKVIDDNGAQVSRHTAFQKAVESAINSKSPTILFPDKLELVHDTAATEDTTPPDTITLTQIT